MNGWMDGALTHQLGTGDGAKSEMHCCSRPTPHKTVSSMDLRELLCRRAVGGKNPYKQYSSSSSIHKYSSQEYAYYVRLLVEQYILYERVNILQRMHICYYLYYYSRVLLQVVVYLLCILHRIHLATSQQCAQLHTSSLYEQYQLVVCIRDVVMLTAVRGVLIYDLTLHA